MKVVEPGQFWVHGFYGGAAVHVVKVESGVVTFEDFNENRETWDEQQFKNAWIRVPEGLVKA